MDSIHGRAEQIKTPAVNNQRNKYLLPVIIISQFAGTSLWFAGNAILPDLQQALQLDTHAISRITSAVQLGFITGTLFFAVLSVADRFSPSLIFFICCCLAATTNAALAWLAGSEWTVLTMRFVTGFFLAGIYPVGMKIAADWYETGLGRALGYLVGALVLGTSFPYLLKTVGWQLPWKSVLVFTSAFALIGGILVKHFIGDGPHRKKGNGFHPSALVNIFRSRPFRAASIGYFGHMWELYTFWAFLPVLLTIYTEMHGYTFSIPLLAFVIIAAGSVSCVVGGYWARTAGSKKVAWYALLCSGCCCIAAPFMLGLSFPFFFLFVLVWSLSVIADSPQFSALVAQRAAPQHKGTALTIVTCIGFSITIVSMIVFDELLHRTDFSPRSFIILAIGPVLGLLALRSPNDRTHNLTT